MAAAGKRHLAQLDGLRGPLCIGVIAINMNLYDVGANLPVGVFLIASGITAYLAYGDRKWDDASHFEFFKKRLVRLLPMVLVSSCFQVCASAVWLDRQASDFAGNLLSVALLLAGSGVCGCALLLELPPGSFITKDDAQSTSLLRFLDPEDVSTRPPQLPPSRLPSLSSARPRLPTLRKPLGAARQGAVFARGDGDALSFI